MTTCDDVPHVMSVPRLVVFFFQVQRWITRGSHYRVVISYIFECVECDPAPPGARFVISSPLGVPELDLAATTIDFDSDCD